jgi:hypothetical protein
MASPDFHRRQAETLAELAKTTRDRHTRAEFLRLAAEHWEWARRRDNLLSRNSKRKPKTQEVA